ncbi:unannotated protein [freshwater metagenome]|uniref:Unannotated protein n=1 Tax=freshwater metagenome TaxID=449393 RepID=A0A6J6FS42_9ZZZZ
MGLAIAKAMSIEVGAKRAGVMRAMRKKAPTTQGDVALPPWSPKDSAKTVVARLTENTASPTTVETNHTMSQITARRLARDVH